MSENEETVELSSVKIDGEGIVSDEVDENIPQVNPNDSTIEDAVDYGGGAKVDPMEKLGNELEGTGKSEEKAPETQKAAENTENTQEKQPESMTDAMMPEKTGDDAENKAETPEKSEEVVKSDAFPPKEEEKFVNEADLTESKKDGFNESSVQDARKDQAVEGGVTKPRTTGPMKNSDASKEGEILKSEPNFGRDAVVGKFEVTGFTVEYETNKGNIKTANIRDYFDDLETAKASVHEGKYLMPLGSGYKMSRVIQGLPSISMEERQLWIYKNDGWYRS